NDDCEREQKCPRTAGPLRRRVRKAFQDVGSRFGFSGVCSLGHSSSTIRTCNSPAGGETSLMNSEYDPLAAAYQRSKLLPFRVYSEIPNHLESLGDVRDRHVLDLACGEGFYTRLIRRAGAARVVGVDLSAEMIGLAREQETKAPLGI